VEVAKGTWMWFGDFDVEEFCDIARVLETMACQDGNMQHFAQVQVPLIFILP